MAKILRSIVALGIAILALVYVVDLKREESRETPTAEPSPTIESSETPAAPNTENAAPATVPPAGPATPSAPSASGAAAENAGGGERVVEFTPSLQTYRAEVAANPHAPPPSIMAFARKIALRMETALQSESAARALIPELAECATRAEVDAPKSVCVINARRLGRKFPALRSEVADLERQTAPAIMKRVEQLDSF